MPRAANGSGWVERSVDRRGYLTLRGKARWRGAVYAAKGVGVPAVVMALPPGRRRDRALAALEQEARALLARLLADLAAGQRPDRARERRPLIAEVRRWLEAKRPKMTPGSHRNYLAIAESHVAPYPVARVPLGQLVPEDVDDWLAALTAAGATSATLRRAYDTLLECVRGCLADGVQFWGLRTIADGAGRRRPRHRAAAATPLDDAQARALIAHCLSAAARERHGVFATVFGLNPYLGLRFGELAGLPWGEVHGLDFPEGGASIALRWQLDRHTRAPREVKSEAGQRIVPLHADARAILLEHRARERARGRACAGDQLVFVNSSRRGGIDRELGYTAARRNLVKLCAEAGLDASGKTHALRRTFASLAGSESAPLPGLQRVMGHADQATTLGYVDQYGPDAGRVTQAVGDRLRRRDAPGI